MEPKQKELLLLTQVRKHLGNSHELQKLGLKVDVHVFRLSTKKGADLTSPGITPTEQKPLVAELAQPWYQLRAEHENEVQAKVATLPIEQQPEAYLEMMRENYIYPKGGFTRVELTNPLDNKVYTGECHFGIDRIFNRSQASKRAFGKMYSKLLAGSSMGKRTGKKVVKELAS